MRTYKTENELREMANKISETITVETYDEENGYSTSCQKTNITEKEIIYNIAYGALSTIKCIDDNECNCRQEAEKAVVDNAESTLDLFLPKSGYDTMYAPLKRILQNWKTA